MFDINPNDGRQYNVHHPKAPYVPKKMFVAVVYVLLMLFRRAQSARGRAQAVLDSTYTWKEFVDVGVTLVICTEMHLENLSLFRIRYFFCPFACFSPCSHLARQVPIRVCILPPMIQKLSEIIVLFSWIPVFFFSFFGGII